MTLMNPNQPDFLSVVERQMQLTEAQGMAIRGLVDGIRQMQEDVAEKVGEVQMLVQEVRDSVTLTDAECYQLQSLVRIKSNALTKDRYKESDEKFKDMVGRYRRMIWSKLKDRFEVAKYSHVRRIDFDDAVDFIKEFRPEDYI
ncbi:ORF6C domain-containing protein [Paenibacillus sp. UMB7766-LJ446]|uniref:ORF6C domain-containing protein n=1 Tax=Paenibacillus sp. UMB7766-LJ446 TaxID=3046313 RepID=UPI00254F0D43|nr:ORF6C domain-containing protein [Paenibacillus sp. UMB7766-LJ446]MDK8188826.1 ORF6C domain-containing protein [Paenibacillus sp. UMB7766-LJ446]